jgi:hypothetical protein
MKIIYDFEDSLSVMTPSPSFLETLDGTEEEKMIYLANKDLPTGTKYEIVDEDFSDRTFRNAWEYVSSSNEKTSEDLSEEDLAKHNMKENL